MVDHISSVTDTAGEVDGAATGTRTKDPRRRERILRAAAELITARSYHAVSMADIGEAAGIVGSGVYRHFDAKVAVLVALLEGAMQGLADRVPSILDAAPDDRARLSALIADHVEFVLEELPLIQLWHRELTSLPDADRRRLRRMQRLYIEEWVHLLIGRRPDVSDGQARLLVHAAIGAIQSLVSYRSGLPRPELTTLLVGAAHDCLGLPRSAPTAAATTTEDDR